MLLPLIVSKAMATWGPLVVIAALLLLAPLVVSDFRLGLLGKFLTFAILALSLNLIWGYGGMLSLGHGVFFGLGGYAMAMFLQQLARSIFGAPNVQVIAPHWLSGGLSLSADLLFPMKRIFIIGLVVVCILGLYLCMYKSHEGRRMRAVMQNREMASRKVMPRQALLFWRPYPFRS